MLHGLSHLNAVTSDLFLWFGIGSIVAAIVMRAVLVLKLRKNYPKIYADIDSPSLIGRMHGFLFKLLKHEDFHSMIKSDKRIVRLFVVLFFIPFIFMLGFFATLTASP